MGNSLTDGDLAGFRQQAYECEKYGQNSFKVASLAFLFAQTLVQQLLINSC